MIHKMRPITIMLLLTIIICIVTSLPASMNLPLVDPGLFVISGVKTCGNSTGYCLLGNDCTMDDDFLQDLTGNCDGLKRAFTPSAPFTCCKFNKRLQKPMIRPDIKKVSTTESIDKLARNTRENIDSSKMDIDQLEKLNQIGSVVKKIVEQLINETANNMIVNDNITDIKTDAEENMIRNEIINDEIPMTINQTEVKETTINPLSKPDDALKNENSETMTRLKNKEETETNNPEIIESEIEEPKIDDEFKLEKNICQKTCKSEVMFIVEKKPTCYGTILDDIWILTSATCASRLNKADIRKVVVSHKDFVGTTLSVSNILVHENFKSPASKNAPENNDLALVSFTVPLQGQECIPCFNQKSNITNEICRSFQNTSFKDTVKPGENCESRVQLRNLINNSYLILPCNRWRMQYNQEGRLGSGLWCDGKLAGVQTGVGVGSLIYTPVNEYAEWISDNKRIEKRR